MRAITGIAVLMLLTSCGSSAGETLLPASELAPTSTASEPACSSFAGKRLTAKAFDRACVVDAATADQLNEPVGGEFTAGTGVTLCEDNRVLIWNDLGWGYEGEPFTMFTADDHENLYPPDAEVAKCSTEPGESVQVKSSPGRA